jgi:flagellin
VSSGLSIVTNVLANQVQFNLDTNEDALATITNQLSSGLRINSAADDPSGLTIATSLQTQTDGFITAVQNVQSAQNAAQVALGAYTTTTDILQRIRSLAVEAASDVSSQADRVNLQAEVQQLILEVNRISENTSFNGQSLLDGSHAGFQPAQNAVGVITANAALANAAVQGGFSPASASTPAGGGTTVTITCTGFQPNEMVTLSYDVLAPTVPPPGTPYSYNDMVVAKNGGANSVTGDTAGLTAPASANANGVIVFSFTTGAGSPPLTFDGFSTSPPPGTISFTNSGFLVASVSAANANFNTTVGVQAYNATGGTYATVDGSIKMQVINTGTSIAVQESFINSATGAISVSPFLISAGEATTIFENTTITTGNFSAPDVGVSAFLKISQHVAALTNPANPAFSFQSGANEGDTILVGIQATNASTLRIANINVANDSGSDPSFGAEDAIGQVDIALQTLLRQQSLLGAVVIRLNEDANNDNISAVNLQAAESSIRDLNVGQATTALTKDQILVQVGTSVLAQANNNVATVLPLFR